MDQTMRSDHLHVLFIVQTQHIKLTQTTARMQTPICAPGVVAESLDSEPHVWEIRRLIPCRVKLMTWYLLFPSLAHGSNRIGQGLVSLSVWIMWLSGSWCRCLISVGQHYRVSMSTYCHKSVPLDVAKDVKLQQPTNLGKFAVLSIACFKCISKPNSSNLGNI